MSATGTGMHAAALPLLVLHSISSPLALSLVVAAAEIPWVLVSLHAGVVVDRLDRRWVMVSDVGRFAVLIALVILILTSPVNLASLVLAAFILGIGQVCFFDVAAQSAIPDFVSRDRQHLSIANGRITAAESNGEDLVGPPLGAALFGGL